MSFNISTILLCITLTIPAGYAAEPTSSVVVAENASNPVAVAAPEVLTPQEAQSLSERAEEPGPEVVGGALSTQTLTYIVIALAAAVLVLIFK